MQARTALVLVFATLASVSCKKDKGFGSGFEGEITMHMARAGAPEEDMVVKAKGDKMRIDTNDAYLLYDPGTNKMTMVSTKQKSFMDLDFSKPGAPQANTSADTATIDKSGKHETIAGMDCESWTAHDPSGKKSEVCIAQGIAFFDMGSMKGGTSALGKELREKKLFPLRSVEYDATGKEISRMQVTKVDKHSIDDAEFVVPKDFTKAAM
jgi:hypothetical protein